MYSRSDRSPISEWWWTIDRWFLASFFGLIAFGVVLSFAASPNVAERIGLDSFHFVQRHVRNFRIRILPARILATLPNLRVFYRKD